MRLLHDEPPLWLAVALAALVFALLTVVFWLASGAYGGTRPPPACAVLHVAATPFSPAYPLEVCGTHLSGWWRCEPATLMHGPALACRRPAESNAGSRRRVKVEPTSHDPLTGPRPSRVERTVRNASSNIPAKGRAAQAYICHTISVVRPDAIPEGCLLTGPHPA